uniref:Uncharacterized protein n=1 Tax=Rhizophora mucronata TaxID=61149 RepID=A0A2P2QC57_RHIMU
MINVRVGYGESLNHVNILIVSLFILLWWVFLFLFVFVCLLRRLLSLKRAKDWYIDRLLEH